MEISLNAHVDNPRWRERAECRGINVNVFHPERGVDTSRPKRICDGCVVRRECLSFALVNYEKHGIWGGMSERERRALRGQLSKAGLLQPPMKDIDHGTASGYDAHRRRNEQPCRLCREAHSAAKSHLANSA